MKTRNLILLALACGLAILVAGGVFLLNVARNRDELTLADALAVGDGAEVGGRFVTVDRVDTVGDTVVIEVRIDPQGEPGGTAADGWALLAAGELADPAAPPEARRDEACSVQTLEVAPATCVLSFVAGKGDATLSYAFGGDQQQWLLPG